MQQVFSLSNKWNCCMLKENFCYAICLILGGARVENSGVNSIAFSIKESLMEEWKNLKNREDRPLESQSGLSHCDSCGIQILKRPMFFVLPKWQENELGMSYECKVNTAWKQASNQNGSKSLFGAELRRTDGCWPWRFRFLPLWKSPEALLFKGTLCTASSRPFLSKEASAAHATHRKRE